MAGRGVQFMFHLRAWRMTMHLRLSSSTGETSNSNQSPSLDGPIFNCPTYSPVPSLLSCGPSITFND